METNAGTSRAVPKIAVLGGGITGLAAAYRLAQARRAGIPVEELLLESGTRLGGLILTERVNGFIVEAGPDSFLAEKPEAAALCRELGLAESLLGSNDLQRRTYIVHSGVFRKHRLVPLPDSFMLFVPTRLWPALTTPLLPLSSKLSAASEWFKKPTAPSPSEGAASGAGPQSNKADDGDRRHVDSPDNDESAEKFIARHFGKGLVENIADPLLAGVFGGDSARLSARSVLPRFYEMEERYGSLSRAALRSRTGQRRKERPPLFLTLREGLGALVCALAAELDSSRVHLRKRVLRIQAKRGLQPTGPEQPAATGPAVYEISCEDGSSYEADAVILALPAYECSRILDSLDPILSDQLGGLNYTSAMTVALGYGPGVRASLPNGFGFLVPRRENRRLLACTFVHKKFADRVPEGKALLRCFLGGARDPDALGLSDGEVLGDVRRELRELLRLRAEPEFFRIYRWPAAMPQYEVGHAERLRAIRERLEHLPGIFLAGNAYSGIGISDSIRTAEEAAQRAMRMLTGTQILST